MGSPTLTRLQRPSLVELEDDVDVRVIGTNGGTRRGPGPVHTLTVVESGPLRLVIPGSYTPATIECLGKLWDLGTRAGPGACHGVIRGIIWHKEVLETTEVRKGVYSSEGGGYYEDAPVSSTGTIGAAAFGAFELIVELLNPSQPR